MSNLVLLVDDDKDFLSMLERYLKLKEFDVITASNVKNAFLKLNKIYPSLILSDVEMPGYSGFDFVKKLRENPKYKDIPLILMSGKKISDIDMLEGYNKGSDDYLIKPFSMDVLSAKIKNILRRIYPKEEKEEIKSKDIILSLSNRKVFLGKKEIKLTKKEFDLLYLLIKNKGKILKYEIILDSIWDYSDKINDPHTIESHISSLRKKLGKKSKIIKNISGHGYILEK